MNGICRNVLVMGVCGVGKSTVAGQLADAFGGHYVEGDSYHSADSVASMSRGVPLADRQRWDWLARITAAVGELNAADQAPAFLACSALKASYRDLLRRDMGPLAVIHLRGDPDTIRRRMNARSGHFMPPTLLESQLRDLEDPVPDTDAPLTVIDIADDIDAVLRTAISFCRRHVAGTGATHDGTVHPKQHVS